MKKAFKKISGFGVWLKSKLPKFLFKNIDPDFEEEKLYNTLIVAMIIGLILVSGLTYYFRTTLYSKKESFSELYFPLPDKLPNIVRQNVNYPYVFSIKSNENKSTTYNYTSGLELYRLYSAIEAKYNCISRLRGKIFLEWTNESLNFSVIDEPLRFEQLQKLYVYPDFEKKINWSDYKVEFSFSPPQDEGIVAIYFRNETDVKYRITLDDYRNLVTIDNTQTEVDFSLTDKNNIVELGIRNGKANLSLNKNTLVIGSILDSKDGQFGFESQDGYYGIFNFKVYEDQPLVVPEKATVLEYTVKDNLFFNKLYEYRELTSKSTPMFRAYLEWHEQLDCKKDAFYCKFFDLRNDVSFFVDNDNISRFVDKIPVTDENANFVLSPTDQEKATINWKSFEVLLSHDQMKVGDTGDIILKFNDKWALMITRNNSYFIRPFRTGVLIDEYRNPEKINSTFDEVVLKMDELITELQINNLTVFRTNTPLDYTNGFFEIFAKNTYMFINPLQLKNADYACETPKFNYCFLTLEVSRSSRAERQTKQEEDYMVENPKSTETSSFNLLKYAKNPVLQNKTEKPVPSSAAKIDIKVANPIIPDRRLVFNTASNTIRNSTNFSMEYSYVSLDGARVVELGLQDFDGNELLSMYVLEKQRQVVIYNDNSNNPIIEKVPWEVNESIHRRLSMEVVNGNANFFVDSKKVFSIENTKISSGQFFLGSRNTYVDLTGARIDVRDKKIFRPVKIKDDPCELKLVYREAKSELLTLEPGKTANITKSNVIRNDFDYGKVFIELYGSGSMNASIPLEIHYWVIKQ